MSTGTARGVVYDVNIVDSLLTNEGTTGIDCGGEKAGAAS